MSEVRKTQMRFFVSPLLKKFQEAHVILEEENSQIQNHIYERLSDLSQPSLHSFIIYLQFQCGITMKTIIQMVRELSKNKDVKKILKQNILKCWIKSQIYSFKKVKRQERGKIAEVIDKFVFKGSSLNKLITACMDAIGQKIIHEEMIKINEIILKDHSDNINSLFSEQILLPKINEDPNKSIPQILNEMLNDYDYFPHDSLEKQVQKELIIAFVQLHSLSSKLQGHKLKGLHNQIGQLQAKIIKNGQRNAKTQQIIKKLKLTPTLYQKYILLSALKARLFGINILQLQRLIFRTQKSKHKMKDRDVILFLGSTGSGKTTTILKFLGYKLKKVLYKDLQTLIPQNLKNQHKGFIASPECTSITRYLNVTEVPQEMYNKYMLKNKRNYCLADSPGFFDTAGIEVEIANKIGVLNGLSDCRSLTIVIIIPYETVIATRGQGLVNISEVIANFFKNYEECQQSILFLFNKVPQECVEEIPLKIKSKIDNLLHCETLKNILNKMLQCSEQKNNYIFPIQTKLSEQTNFKALLERIFKMDKINNPNLALKNGFTKSIYSEVNTYILSKKQMLQQSIEQGKINEAKFYYDLIIKLRNIFDGNDDSINPIIQKIQVYFTKMNALWLQHIRKGIQLLQQNKLNSKLIAELKQARKNILQFSKYFEKQEHSKQLQLLVTAQKQQFYQYFIIQKSDNYHLFQSIKTFSNILIPQLLNNFAEIIQAQLLQLFNSINYSIETKRINELIQKIPILLNSIKILNNFKTSVQIQQKLNFIIKQIEQLFHNYLKQIKQLIMNKNISITDRYINLFSTNFDNLKQLQAFKLIKKIDTKKQLNNFLKLYRSRFIEILNHCKNDISNLLEIQPQQLKIPPSNQVKQIKSTIKQIFINATFKPLSKEFNDQIKHTKQKILQQLDKNFNRLCQYVYSIKYDKIKDIKDKFIFAKNNYFVLIKICEIIEERKPVQQINIIITEKIMEIVQFLGKTVDSLEVKLTPLLKNNIEKAKQYLQIIQNLQTVNDISLQLNEKVQQLRKTFIKRLQCPFIDFQQFINNSLTISNQYTFSSLIFQKIQRFCYYSIELSKLLTHKDRTQSNQHEYNIQQKISSFIIDMKSKIDCFVESTSHDQSIIKLIKQYIRSIISLNQKQPTKIYLSNTIGIQTSSILSEIRYKIDEIINEITQSFETITSKTFEISEVLQIAQKCKKYVIIQQAIQSKKTKLYLNNFLQKKINKYLSNNIKNDKQTAIFHIKGNKPSNINFQQVSIINQRLNLLNTAEANEKKIKIYNEIRNIEKGVLNSLKIMRNQMSKQVSLDNISRHQFLEYFQSFNEAFILQRELNKLYKQGKYFQMSNAVHQTAKTIIYYFQNIHENILKYFEQFRVKNIATTINIIAFIESQLNQQQYFNPQQEESSIDPKRSQIIKSLQQFTNTSISFIQAKIDNYGQTSMMLSSISFNHINLRKYLQIWQQKMQQNLQNTYCKQSQQFKPDERFKTYYFNNYSDPTCVNTPQLHQKKQQIDRNIENYFQFLQKQYKQSQTQYQKTIQIQWQESLRYLPSSIKQPYRQKLKELRQSIKIQTHLSTLLVSKAFSVEKQDSSFQEIVHKFTQEYYKENQDSFLEEVERNQFFGNKCLMMKKGIDLEAFRNQMSPFFGEIKQSQFFLRKFKKQLKENQNIIDEFLKNYETLQRNMKNTQNMPTLKKKLSFW